jgi:hypothetical protein
MPDYALSPEGAGPGGIAAVMTSNRTVDAAPTAAPFSPSSGPTWWFARTPNWQHEPSDPCAYSYQRIAIDIPCSQLLFFPMYR